MREIMHIARIREVGVALCGACLDTALRGGERVENVQDAWDRASGSWRARICSRCGMERHDA